MLTFFRGRLAVSPFALVLLLIMSLSPDAPFFAAALICAGLHECGHIAAMRLFGARITRFSLYPFGADITAETGRLSYKAEALCALAGPLVSLVLALVTGLLFLAFRNVYILSAAVSNFMFFAVNILPVRGLDGGRILLSALLSGLDYSLAYRIFSAASTVGFGVLCFAAFVLLAASGYNLSLVFICTYLFMSEYVKSKVC